MSRRRRGSVHPISVLGQARADLWPLVVTMLVLGLTTFLAVTVPGSLATMADQAVRTAATAPGSGADLTITVPLSEGQQRPRALRTDTAANVEYVADRLDQDLPAELAAVLDPPRATLTSVPLRLAPLASGPAWLRFTYLWQGGEPDVTWLDGGPPRSTVTPLEVAAAPGAGPWPVEVALAQDVAALLQVQVGDALGVDDEDLAPLDVRVSGIFSAADPDAPVWSATPGLLRPRVLPDGPTTRTEVAALLSGESLAPARLAVRPAGLSRTFTLAVDPDALTYARAEQVAARTAALEAAPSTLAIPGAQPTITSRLDVVLTEAVAGVQAATAQAWVLLTGVVVAAGLVLALAARLVVRRRTPVLVHHRARGASLPAIALGLGIEAATLAALGGGIGLGSGLAVHPGPIAWGWVAPAIALTVLAGPLEGLRTARAIDPRRAPADRHRRRRADRAGRLRRTAAEAAVVLVAVGAVTALRTRGSVTSAAGLGADLLVVAAPTLLCAAVALLVVRALPGLAHWVLTRTARSRRVVPVLSAARVEATSTAALPFVTLVVCASLLTFGASVGQTVRAGQVEGSWDSVGADVLVRTTAHPGLTDLAQGLRTPAGTRAAAAGLVTGDVQLFAGSADELVRVVALDSHAFADLLNRAPLEAAPQLADLTTVRPDGRLPVLLSPDLAELGAGGLSMRWDGTSIPLSAAGVAPRLVLDPGTAGGTAGGTASGSAGGSGDGPVAVVDRDALEAVTGAAVVPDTLWAVGPGVEQAVRATPGIDRAAVSSRAGWLAARQADPLIAGLDRVVTASVLALLALAVVVVVLTAAASAPGRAITLATLRVLGLGPREVGRVALGELLPTALAGALLGAAFGAATVGLVLGPLDLRLLTGQVGDPDPALPWWLLVPAGLLAGTVAVIVAVESSVRRRERLGQVMRVGGR